MASAEDCHVEQGLPWSCVAACTCMLYRARGIPPFPNEDALLAAWPCPKTDIQHAAVAGVVRVWDPTDPRSLDRLRGTLQRSWIIVTLFPGPLTFFTMRRQPRPVSRHGPLIAGSDTRDAPGLPHAVVLVSTDGSDRVLYLDPYYPVTGQPFSLSDDELIEAWTGVIVIADP